MDRNHADYVNTDPDQDYVSAIVHDWDSSNQVYDEVCIEYESMEEDVPRPNKKRRRPPTPPIPPPFPLSAPVRLRHEARLVRMPSIRSMTTRSSEPPVRVSKRRPIPIKPRQNGKETIVKVNNKFKKHFCKYMCIPIIQNTIIFLMMVYLLIVLHIYSIDVLQRTHNDCKKCASAEEVKQEFVVLTMDHYKRILDYVDKLYKSKVGICSTEIQPYPTGRVEIIRRSGTRVTIGTGHPGITTPDIIKQGKSPSTRREFP
nr:MAG: hypothetical protein [Wenzhou rodent jeilongvirus 1]